MRVKPIATARGMGIDISLRTQHSPRPQAGEESSTLASLCAQALTVGSVGAHRIARLAWLFFSLTALPMSSSLAGAPATTLQVANYCGELTNAYGPFDYTNGAYKPNLRLVESGHFSAEVEKLSKGVSSSLGSDLDYTLRAFPNHHRALMAIAKLSLRDKMPRPRGARRSVDCYFDRAIRFKPDDGIVHMVYGIYLSNAGNHAKAIEQLHEAVTLEPENANINYNLGLLYFNQKEYGQAKKYAQKAYALNFPLPGLKKKLAQLGQWEE